jgi:hypothetical protein
MIIGGGVDRSAPSEKTKALSERMGPFFVRSVEEGR